MPKIKICGLFRQEDISYVNEARPDYAGFVFAKSRRQVTASQAARLRSGLGEGIVPVGVFVNAPVQDIAALYREGVIAAVQLHGSEDKDYIRRLKDVCEAPAIKAVSVRNREDLLPWAAGSGADFLLLDHGAGGTGERFNWQLVLGDNPADGTRPGSGQDTAGCTAGCTAFSLPYFIAGGITVHNITEALSLKPDGPKPYGIDVSSGAETGGVKDRDKILKLVELVRRNGGLAE
ncbi:MAG: phosphoribosylanthranilate isomerase [Treponema sp.]|jgi:phosphoribosylanthranilate isomerase|nr:phosphoribosylanthranilate isomerase [Treponema sp.]